ncbi:hypothetical protein PLICRDRAFT_633547 [Plicaturopsis crispa FD-325 SS-3]|nr:hypothetical protein PLICRDRAFT_633547 [Plicaturopsis crispa FD-325 SS-3]
MSDDSPNEDIVSATRDIITHNYFHFLAIALFYYDQLLTTPDEIMYIWARPRSTSSIAFLFNRWFGFWANLTITVMSFIDIPDERCHTYNFARQILLIISEVIVSYLLMLRTYALYQRSRRILYSILGVAFAFIGLTGWSLTGQKSSATPNIYSGCHIGNTPMTGIHLAVPWEALFAFDTMIFFLTLSATYKGQHRHEGLMLTGDKLPLLSLLLRDGAMYFCGMAFANLANILTFYLSSAILKGFLSTFASNLSVTLMSRLMLNLHSVGTVGIMTSGPSDPRTGMVFTSRLLWSEVELSGATSDHDHVADPRGDDEAAISTSRAAEPAESDIALEVRRRSTSLT